MAAEGDTFGFDVAALLEAAARQTAEGTVKVQEDLDRYRAVIAQTRPEALVECGTFEGGSARWFAQLVPLVVSVDNVPRLDREPPGVRLVTGDSTDPLTVELVAGLVAGRRTMVVLDSDHSAGHVAAEIRAYGPLVSPGCYLVVEDGVARWIAGDERDGSPLDAIEQHLAGNAGWLRDEQIERASPITMHPMGWWIRAS
jgi:cephalosporin hydroxylase